MSSSPCPINRDILESRLDPAIKLKDDEMLSMPIYLDYAATTPIDPRVIQKMLENLSTYGNSSSPHLVGKAAKNVIENARIEVANLLHATPEEIIWTSGATEANNLALKGAVSIYQPKGKHIVTLKTEHSSVLGPCFELEKQGFSVTYLKPNPDGLLDFEVFKKALRPDTILVSIMHVNNEIGVIQDIKKLAEETRSRGILFHTDATQSIGKLSFNIQEIPVDLISFSAHKIYGPKGIGALYIRRKPRVKLFAQIHGGGQEQGIRSGTLPTHQIVGMGEACAIAKNEMATNFEKLILLREHFLQAFPNAKLHGSVKDSFPGIVNISFPGKIATSLMNTLPELAFSIGSACLSKNIQPSHVLHALGLGIEESRYAMRFSFGNLTTLKDLDFAIALLQKG